MIQFDFSLNKRKDLIGRLLTQLAEMSDESVAQSNLLELEQQEQQPDFNQTLRFQVYKFEEKVYKFLYEMYIYSPPHKLALINIICTFLLYFQWISLIMLPDLKGWGLCMIIL